MAFLPSDSAIRVDSALEEKLKSASFEEIKAHLATAAVEQRLVVPDAYDNSVLIPTNLVDGPQPQKFARSVIIDGTKHVVQADSELALEKSVGDLYRAQLQPVAMRREQPRGTDGRVVEQMKTDEANQVEIMRRSELDLKFRRGELDAATYLEQSGAVAAYLEKAGVPLEDLKASVAEKQSEQFTQSWADATETFKSRHPEWVGGDANRNTLAQTICENNLVDAEDKVAALEAAYNYARKNNLLVENPDTAYQRELQEARSAADIDAVNQKYFGGSGSRFFNR
jgi:hypothetical protein